MVLLFLSSEGTYQDNYSLRLTMLIINITFMPNEQKITDKSNYEALKVTWVNSNSFSMARNDNIPMHMDTPNRIC